MKPITCRACANIAIVKYWGKREETLNLPTQNSFSVSVAALCTTTTAQWGDFESDQLSIDGQITKNSGNARFVRILDKIREISGAKLRCIAVSENSFPGASGLASSASGMAALAAAASSALALSLPDNELSALARLGSGSASRSIPGGWCEWLRGEHPDGSDSYAVRRFAPGHWPLDITIALVSEAPKPISSSQGMKLCKETSIFWEAFQRSVSSDIECARLAVESRDFERFADVCERACLRMHAANLGAVPPFAYCEPMTIEIIRRVQAMRARGVQVCFTMDAGANVVLFSEKCDTHCVLSELDELSIKYIQSEVGCGICEV